MPNTPVLGLPYPASTDSADVPRDIKALADAVEAAGVLPAGVIQMWPGTIAPAGWAILNGTPVDAAANPKLAAIFGSAGGQVPLPDWRSAVPRGASANTGEGLRTVAGANSHAITQNELPVHVHDFGGVPPRQIPYASNIEWLGVAGDGVGSNLFLPTMNTGAVGQLSQTSGGGFQNFSIDMRTRSGYVNFIIKLG